MSELIDLQKNILESMGLLAGIQDRRVLVTGAGGFVGLHLCEALVELGAEVHALSRSADTYGLPVGVQTHSIDLQDLNSVKDRLSVVKPEVVYHLAGLVNTRQDLNLVLPTLNNNLVGSVNLLLALAEKPCQRLVVVGSSEEPTAGRLGAVANSPYAASKEAATEYAKMFHDIFSLPVVITRPFMSYGPRQPVKKIIPYVITSFLAGISPEISSGKRICDLIYIQDLVMGLILSGIRPNLIGESIDLGTGNGSSIYDAVNLVSEIMGSPTQAKFGALPDRLYEAPQIANIEMTFQLLGYRPQWSLSDGIKSTIDWYRKNPDFYIMER
jgi:nucleoside-diphosphate-sugar epimerase